ncbi:hypothetical protein [Natronobacterium texcoconense]|nr:hypothetical protein [Natronobacterium texcoconense]
MGRRRLERRRRSRGRNRDVEETDLVAACDGVLEGVEPVAE